MPFPVIGLPFCTLGFAASAPELEQIALSAWGELDKLATMGDDPAKFTSILVAVLRRYTPLEQTAIAKAILVRGPEFAPVVGAAMQQAGAVMPPTTGGQSKWWPWGVIAVVTVIGVSAGAYMIVR